MKQIILALVLPLATLAYDASSPADVVTEASVRGHMEFLASDALSGRGSGTRDEWIAATYVAAQLRRWGIEPLGDRGGYLQAIDVSSDVTPQEPRPGRTWNVVGRLLGSDPLLAEDVILLSAHLDSLGSHGNLANPIIYHGADDDASGVVAVLELAEAFAKGVRSKRTILFAWFGSEETDSRGAQRFIGAPPVPLSHIVANLEFEMLGRADPAVAPRTAWLAGFERTNLGPELVRHGANIVADPHPEQQFFERSDNIQLAYRGVIAHTVSSFGLHPDYHRPSDDLSRIQFEHLTAVIRSLIAPIGWLASSQFTPHWNTGTAPADVGHPSGQSQGR
jgi:hypothetical protein